MSSLLATDHSVKQSTVAKKMPNAQTVAVFSRQFIEVMNSQAKTDPTPSIEKIAVLVDEVLSKIRTVLNTMSYSDIINIVSDSASRIFNEKIDGQRTHDSIKSADTAPVISIQTNNLPNRQNFSQNG